MPLNFHLDSIADHEQVCFETVPAPAENGSLPRPRISAVTEALIHLTMATGINRITAGNAYEFYGRAAAVEEVIGVFVHQVTVEGAAPRPITLADVRAHIGLHTNASPLNATEFEQMLHAERQRQSRLATY